MADTFYHALVLSLHQPPGNLEALLERSESEARDILLAMARIPQALSGAAISEEAIVGAAMGVQKQGVAA